MENGNNGNKSPSASRTTANNKVKQGGSAVAGFLIVMYFGLIGVIIVCAIGQPKTTKGMKYFFIFILSFILSIIFPPLIIILIVRAIVKKTRKRKEVAHGAQICKKQPSRK